MLRHAPERCEGYDPLMRVLITVAAAAVMAACSQASTPQPASRPAAGADSVVPANGPACMPVFEPAPDLIALHTQHPPDKTAPGTLALDSPPLQRVLAMWSDPRAFVSQATPRQLADYGFIGEPAYATGPVGPHSPDDPVDVVVFHGNWSAGQVNLHGAGHGAHVRWVLVDARSGMPFGGGSADCTDE